MFRITKGEDQLDSMRKLTEQKVLEDGTEVKCAADWEANEPGNVLSTYNALQPR